jgi:hypothetical protein
VGERVLHRDLGKVTQEAEIMNAARAILFDQFLVHLRRGSRATT